MRLGLLGLGRIGAFHAETLAGLSLREHRPVRIAASSALGDASRPPPAHPGEL